MHGALQRELLNDPRTCQTARFGRAWWIKHLTLHSLYTPALEAEGQRQAQRQAGPRTNQPTAQSRLRQPSRRTAAGRTCSHSVVEVVTDDMPFLIDSVTRHSVTRSPTSSLVSAAATTLPPRAACRSVVPRGPAPRPFIVLVDESLRTAVGPSSSGH
ncbi:hypothetical protein [Streptomyces sp. NPDC048196]|uniref:hypothetical protein n=1 Tax=Streptomyces sp. NPDC048196 TaxID=3154712 RepID=UPI0033D7E9FA